MIKALPLLAAALLVVTLTSLGIHWLEMELAVDGASEVILAVPAIWAVLVVAGISALIFRLTGFRLLTRQQLLLTAFAGALASPLLTQGFWHRMFGGVTTIPREGQLAKLTSLSDRLWPHGPNLAEGWITGATVIDAAHPQTLTVTALTAGEPVLATALVRATELPTGTVLKYALLADGVNATDVSAGNLTLGSLNRPSQADPLRVDGAESIGGYGYVVPPSVSGSWRLDLRLSGPGSVEVQRVQLHSVAAVENALAGARSADRGLSAAHQVVPWSAWRDPLIAWGSFLGLLFCATYAVNAIMRKQWIDAERFPLPIGRAWSMLVGAEVDQPSPWRSPWLLVPAGVTCLWCLLRWAHQLNPGIPDLGLAISLKDHLRDPAWGDMWGITFSLSAICIGTALFFEVGLLGSMLVGFALFRCMFWLGERSGLNTDTAYPWRFEQQVGAFVAYGLIILVSARRHLIAMFGQVVRGTWQPVDGEALSARVSAGLLLACAGGTMWWAWWTGVGLLGTGALMAFLLLVGIVSSRLRAESGLIYSLFAPYSAGTVLLALGGIGTFGSNAVLLAFVASFFLAANTFFIPGAQLELINVARRERLGAWSTASLTVIGIGGGIVIGGWVYLTSVYGVGADNMRYHWAFDTKPWYFGGYNSAVSMVGAGENGHVSWSGYAVGLIATAGVSAIRLLAPGFALHPSGMLFGPSYMLEMFWGSVLVAFIVRWSVVRAGGAEVVRTKLLPLAMGLLVGSALAYLVIGLHTAILLHAGSDAPSIGSIL